MKGYVTQCPNGDVAFVDDVGAAITRDRVGARRDIGEAAASDREGFGSTRLRDRDASPGHRGGDRLHSLDRVRGAQSVEFGRSRRQVARARNNM